MKYKLHIPFGSRTDLVEEAVSSARDIGNIHLWASGIDCPDIPDVTKHEPGLVTIVSLINMCLKESWDDDVMFLMHNDAFAKEGAAKKMLEFTENAWKTDPKWGMVFSHYDVLCAFNMKAVHEVGVWDTMYFQYRADVDYYHGLKKAGWHELNSGLNDEIIHHGSTSIKSDALFNHRTQFRNRRDFDSQYYVFKWGGPPGGEKFQKPFQDFVPNQHYKYAPVRPHPMFSPAQRQAARNLHLARSRGAVKA
jgi:hypothetical protein